MTPEALLLRVCLLLAALAAAGLWALRDGTRLSAWLDRELNAATTLPQPNIIRTDRYL